MPTPAPTRLTKPAAWYRERLRPPSGTIPVVIDTDAANEIDDQFALAWALSLRERLGILGMYATPFSFSHRRSLYPQASAEAPPFNAPDVGMQRSFEELLHVQSLMHQPTHVPCFLGSPGYLTSLHQPIQSQSTRHLIETALQMPRDEPLYVVALGCATNVASALLLAPEIAERIVVVWTSAFPSHAPHQNKSFNLEQDLLASQWLYDSGVPLVYLPGFHVGVQLRLSLAEVERFVKPHGQVGAYLHHLFTNNPLWSILGKPEGESHSWVIWDLINIAWLVNPDWIPSHLVNTPYLRDDLRWAARPQAHPMREAYAVQRDAIFNDFFARLPIR